MFCPTCGTPSTPGLSFCNRCGASLKEERPAPIVRTGAIVAFLIAVTIIGIGGLGIMLGGAVTLKRDAVVNEEVVGMFMFFTFLILMLIEFFLVRQLSKLVSGNLGQTKRVAPPTPAAIPNELRPAQARGLPEAMPSVTENTTRTLEYSRNEPPR